MLLDEKGHFKRQVFQEKDLGPDAERDRVRRGRAGEARGVRGKLRRRSKRAEQRARDGGASFAARQRLETPQPRRSTHRP